MELAETESRYEKPGELGFGPTEQTVRKELLALPQAASPAQGTRCSFSFYWMSDYKM